MATHRIGPETGRFLLRTTRQGLAAQAGHDLTIEVTRWSGEISDDPDSPSVTVTIDLSSLEVLDGTGGVKPLGGRDKREIAKNARKVLGADTEPEATYRSAEFVADGNGGGSAEGELTLHGQTRPVTVTVTAEGEGSYRGTATVVQTEYGIKPYTGFLGALKVADAVMVEAEVELG
jgi:polyisoprenoid-binding protein YceI